jgi:hypothetical protein
MEIMGLLLGTRVSVGSMLIGNNNEKKQWYHIICYALSPLIPSRVQLRSPYHTQRLKRCMFSGIAGGRGKDTEAENTGSILDHGLAVNPDMISFDFGRLAD